jgi:hypothetical protein
MAEIAAQTRALHEFMGKLLEEWDTKDIYPLPLELLSPKAETKLFPIVSAGFMTGFHCQHRSLWLFDCSFGHRAITVTSIEKARPIDVANRSPNRSTMLVEMTLNQVLNKQSIV